MGIVFVQFVIGFVISIPINMVTRGGAVQVGQGGQEMAILASLIQLPIGFLVAAGVRTTMLPTAFPRACLVVLFEYLIIFGICLAVGVPLFLLLGAGAR